ncbi:hypothetical protein [Pseudanabaena sp. PCC 6802]|uniref:hypothetical protein n=1 Tax=Pseudanabaena sp. PCC 6802 TaxID=118173 RepID=UPI000349CE75|nr:hypothetical protein [Pseudanabaena sp. PCC 6802]
MIASLIAFVLSVLAIVSISFVLSYLVWADRSHTPEVVAAEASLFFQKVESILLAFLIGGIACAVFLTQMQWQ